MNYSRLFAILGFLAIAIASRLLPHPPNFTSIGAAALLGVAYFGSRLVAFAIVSLSIFLSDLALGSHSTMPFVYLSFGLTILLGEKLNNRYQLQIKYLPLFSIATSLLFFVVANFGVWLKAPIYPHTMNGLISCYIAAIPFLGNQILGDLFYGVTLYAYLCLISRQFAKA